MTLTEIKAAVDAGLTVHWAHTSYIVRRSPATGNYNVVCTDNGYCTGLTWRDGTTLNGNPTDFYVSR
jgi:hypothetical protein